ncbi:hypothetical protein STEG23_004147, partial [Scotinomys teguina]
NRKVAKHNEEDITKSLKKKNNREFMKGKWNTGEKIGGDCRKGTVMTPASRQKASRSSGSLPRYLHFMESACSSPPEEAALTKTAEYMDSCTHGPMLSISIWMDLSPSVYSICVCKVVYECSLCVCVFLFAACIQRSANPGA